MGLLDKIKEVIGVTKLSQMDAEQVKVWKVSFASAVNQFTTENPDVDVDVNELLTGESSSTE